MELLTKAWKARLGELLDEATTDVLIISPFIKSVAEIILKPHLEGKRFRCRIITRWRLADFWQGASDYETIGNLIQLGAQVKALKRLHAKAYLFDGAKAVVASANFTSGGMGGNHEWGGAAGQERVRIAIRGGGGALVLSEESRQLLGRGSCQGTGHTIPDCAPAPLLDEEEVLPDEGEDLPDGPPESHPVALKARTSRELQAVRDAVTVAASNARIGGAADFRRLCQDLADTEYTGVSMQAFLWLVGYCNTGASYEQASKDYAKPLACAMFGYVPEEVFTSSGWNVKLKTFRWGTRMPPDLEEAILASHRGRAGI